MPVSTRSDRLTALVLELYEHTVSFSWVIFKRNRIWSHTQIIKLSVTESKRGSTLRSWKLTPKENNVAYANFEIFA